MFCKKKWADQLECNKNLIACNKEQVRINDTLTELIKDTMKQVKSLNKKINQIQYGTVAPPNHNNSEKEE